MAIKVKISFSDLFLDEENESLSPKDKEAVKIIRQNMLWSMGVGFVPFPILDLIGVTMVQLDMLKSLCRLYEVNYSEVKGKALISSLAGASMARFWASFIKGIPLIGSIFGGVSMAILSGASTYALGRVFIQYLKDGSGIEDIPVDDAKVIYEEEFEKGKKVAENLKQEEANIQHKLEQLQELKEKGIITEEEFEAKKKEWLDKM